MRKLYLIGSLRNPQVCVIANRMRDIGWDVFDDWYAAGPEADDMWQRYEEERGRTYAEALDGYAATHVFRFDRHHLDECDAGLLVLPAGKSGHLELGYLLGKGVPSYILLPEKVERWDVMYKFATAVLSSEEELLEVLA